MTLSADITERKTIEPDQKLESTFYCELLLEVFVEEFEHALSQMLTTRVPTDEWKEMATSIKDKMQRKLGKTGGRGLA